MSNRVIIAGSRSAVYSKELGDKVMYLLKDLTDLEIVSGTARGADKIGEQIAKNNNIPVKRFPADWDKHGKSAGVLRNREMAQYGTHLILIWDGVSKGSKSMLEEARKRGLHIRNILI